MLQLLEQPDIHWDTAVFKPGEKMTMSQYYLNTDGLNLPPGTDADKTKEFSVAFATDLRDLSSDLGKKWRRLRERQMRDNPDLGFTSLFLGDKRVVPGYKRAPDAEMAYLRIMRRRRDRIRRDALKQRGTFARPP